MSPTCFFAVHSKYYPLLADPPATTTTTNGPVTLPCLPTTPPRPARKTSSMKPVGEADEVGDPCSRGQSLSSPHKCVRETYLLVGTWPEDSH